MFEQMLESGRIPVDPWSRRAVIASTGAHAVVIAAVMVGALYLFVGSVRDPRLPIEFVATLWTPPPAAPSPPPAPRGTPGAASTRSTRAPASPALSPTAPSAATPSPTPPPAEAFGPPSESADTPVEGDVGLPDGELGGGPGGRPGGTGTDPDATGTGGPGDPGDEPIVPGPDVELPRLIHKVMPRYPELARIARMEGRVVCRAVIDREGRVADVVVLEARHPVFAAASIEAVKQWRYEPARRGGEPTVVYLTVVVDFTLH